MGNHNADLAHLVERDLAKVEVAGSSPVIRSTKWARFKSCPKYSVPWPSGKAKVCNTSIPSSILGGTSKKLSNPIGLLNFLSKPTKEAWYVINALARCM